MVPKVVLGKHKKKLFSKSLYRFCIPLLYFRLRMELIQWPSCQADYWSSSESSGDDFEGDNEDIEDALTFTETPETKEKIG